MKTKKGITPIDSSRDFRINELFFSQTDRKGVIVSGNAVFSRVADYTLEEMKGKAHNIIRHPDMPRAVFKTLWDFLKASKPIAAYVKNMAKDGRDYWVLALVAPVEDGYLSVRFKPSSALFPLVEEVYRELRAIELDHDEREEEPKAGMLAAEARLVEILNEKGFADYDAFMRAVLQHELASLDTTLASDGLDIFVEIADSSTSESSTARELRGIYKKTQRVSSTINSLGADLQSSSELNEQLTAQARSILSLAEEFRYVPMNVEIKTSQMGEGGLALSMVATHLGEASKGVLERVVGLTARAGKVSVGLGESIFDLGWARLQFDMTTSYYHEMFSALSEERDLTPRLDNLRRLRVAFSQTTERAVQSLRSVENVLGGLDAEAEDLSRAMLQLEVAHIAGLIEASRLTDDDNIVTLFEGIRGHIDDIKKELIKFSDVILRLAKFAQQAPAIVQTVTDAADTMRMNEEQIAETAQDDATLTGYGTIVDEAVELSEPGALVDDDEAQSSESETLMDIDRSQDEELLESTDADDCSASPLESESAIIS